MERKFFFAYQPLVPSFCYFLPYYHMEALGKTLDELTESNSKITPVVKIELEESDADLISLPHMQCLIRQVPNAISLSISLYNAKVRLVITLLKTVAIVAPS